MFSALFETMISPVVNVEDQCEEAADVDPQQHPESYNCPLSVMKTHVNSCTWTTPSVPPSQSDPSSPSSKQAQNMDLVLTPSRSRRSAQNKSCENPGSTSPKFYLPTLLAGANGARPAEKRSMRAEDSGTASTECFLSGDKEALRPARFTGSGTNERAAHDVPSLESVSRSCTRSLPPQQQRHPYYAVDLKLALDWMVRFDARMQTAGKVWRDSLTPSDLVLLRVAQICFASSQIIPLLVCYLPLLHAQIFYGSPQRQAAARARKFPATLSYNVRRGWPRLVNHAFWAAAWGLVLPLVARKTGVRRVGEDERRRNLELQRDVEAGGTTTWSRPSDVLLRDDATSKTSADATSKTSASSKLSSDDEDEVRTTPRGAPDAAEFFQHESERLRLYRCRFANFTALCSILCLFVFRLNGGRKYGPRGLLFWNVLHYLTAGSFMSCLGASTRYLWNHRVGFRASFLGSCVALLVGIFRYMRVKSRLGSPWWDEAEVNLVHFQGLSRHPFLRAELKRLFTAETLIMLGENSLFMTIISGMLSGIRDKLR